MNGNHTIFGEVVSDADIEVVKLLSNNDVMEKVEIEGDVNKILDTYKDRVDEWNRVLGY